MRVVKNPPANAGEVREVGLIRGLGRSPSHSSILAWRIPRAEEPGGLLSMGWQRVGHSWSNLAQHSTALTSDHRTTARTADKPLKKSTASLMPFLGWFEVTYYWEAWMYFLSSGAGFNPDTTDIFGTREATAVGTTLCTMGFLVASLASTQQMPGATPGYDKPVCRLCQISPWERQPTHSQMRIIVLREFSWEINDIRTLG